MREQYDELDAEAVTEKVAGKELIGYDMNFYCLDLTNTAQVRSFRTPDGVLRISARRMTASSIRPSPCFAR